VSEFLQDHPVWSGLVFFILAFALNVAWRAYRAARGIPAGVRLQWILAGAAAGIRRYHMARRELRRAALMTAFGGDGGILLARARRALDDAVGRLNRALRLAPRFGCPPATLQSLNAHWSAAERLREQLAQSGTPAAFSRRAPPGGQALKALLAACEENIGRADAALVVWAADLARGGEVAAGIDRVLRSSGGTLRNPLRREGPGELDETRTVLSLARSRRDYQKAEACLQELKRICADLPHAEPLSPADVRRLAAAMDALSTVMGDAEEVLPEVLVSHEVPGAELLQGTGQGVLQQLFEQLCQLEAALHIRLR
jgi:hypothetical protein